MRVAVTGASGFIGQHLVRSLRAQGHDVLPVVRQAQGRGEVELAQLLEGQSLPDLDVLIHAASVRHRHGVDERTYRASNVDLVARLLGRLEGRARRFVYVSSVGVYGFPQRLPIDESHPFEPRTLYSRTKVEAERLVRERASRGGWEYTIVRPTITYGAGDRNGMLDKLVGMIRARRYLLVGNGRNTLHHTHVDDMVHGIECAAFSDGAKGEDFILCGPETTTLRGLSELVAESVGRRLPPVHVPLGIARRVASVMDGVTKTGLAFQHSEPPINHEKLDVMTLPISFSSRKAEQRIGFRPSVGYREGIRRTLLAEVSGPLR